MSAEMMRQTTLHRIGVNMKTVVSTIVTIAALMMPRCLAATPKENGDAGKKTAAGSPVQTGNSPVELRKLMDTPLRDPSICVGPDGTYYLTGTSEPFWGFKHQNGIRIWKSRDLAAWEPLGTVWRYGESPWHQKHLLHRHPGTVVVDVLWSAVLGAGGGSAGAF
jgi:hypothetical protein